MASSMESHAGDILKQQWCGQRCLHFNGGGENSCMCVYCKALCGEKALYKCTTLSAFEIINLKRNYF